MIKKVFALLLVTLSLFNCQKSNKEIIRNKIVANSNDLILFDSLFHVNMEKTRDDFLFPFEMIHTIERKGCMLKDLSDQQKKYTDINKFGEKGISYFDFVFFGLLQDIVRLDVEGNTIVELRNDNSMIWDGAYSRLFSELIIEEGQRMKPIVSKFSDEYLRESLLEYLK